MKLVLQDDARTLLRFDPGEDVLAGLLSFAEKEQITAATFTAIGAAGAIVLSYYDLPKKTYLDSEINEDVEIVSVTGNIGRMKKSPIIHAHGVFAKRDFTTIGGHIKKMIVSATCEVSLIELDGEIIRGLDSHTGLNLMK